MNKLWIKIAVFIFIIGFVIAFNYGGCGGGGSDSGSSTSAQFLTTNPATNVTQTTATINGTVIPNGVDTFVSFQYGTTTTYGTDTASQNINLQAGSSTTPINLSANLTGLSPNTIYNFRIRAIVGSSYTGVIHNGANRTFTTVGLLPICDTNAATNIIYNSAQLNATVNPNGGDTTAYFQWGTITSYGTTTISRAIGSGTSNVTISATAGSLTTNTLYNFRVVGTNAFGTTYGNNLTFTTPPPPTSTTYAAFNITINSAILYGTVNPNGLATNAYFQYGLIISYGNNTSAQNLGSGTSVVAVAATITGLSVNRTYYFRISGTNAAGTTYGNNRTFTTGNSPGSAPTCTTDPADNITSSSARLNGTVIPNGVATDVYFNYGLTTSYTLTTTAQAIGSGITSVTTTATAAGTLTPNALYNFRVAATNSGGKTNGSNQTFTTPDVNRPPVLAAIGNKSVDEGTLLTFTVSATDPNVVDTLTYSATGLPNGASFNSTTKTFSWAPSYTQSGSYTDIIFTVTDNGIPNLSDFKQITILVGNVNQPPVLAAIGNRSVNEGATLTFTISATDPDGDTITYSTSTLPTGASFNPTTKTFSWTPSYTQSGSYPNITFTATDNGTPNLSTPRTITISVGNVNRPPVLATIGGKSVNEGSLLTFTVSATDPDVFDTLTYSATGLPTGANFNPTTKTFSWTPGYSQSGNDPVVTFTVTDNGSPNQSDFEQIVISVGNVNQPPVLAAIGNQNVAQYALLTFTVSATDPDGDTITYSTSTLPTGANFNPTTKTFSWTPDTDGNYNVTFTVIDNGTPNLSDFEQITISVGNVNRPPVLAAIGNRSVNEGAELTFTISATDPDGNAITYSATDLPTGANFNPTTRTFSWTPSYTQSGYPNVTFTATDNGTPNLSDSETIIITVNEINRAPVLAAIGNRSVNEGALLQFTLSATDPDSGDTLTYSATSLPSGANLVSTTGVFSWTPDYTQSGSYPNVTFIVTDNGTPNYTDSESITITVNNVPAPTCTTTNASNIAGTTATLNGTVNPNGTDVTSCIFQYWTTTPYGTTISATPYTFSSTTNVSAAISSLSTGTIYNFRVVATNAAGTTNGNNLSFIIPDYRGTGVDGALTVSSSFNINTQTNGIGGRTVADGWNSRVSAFAADNTATLATTPPANTFAAGDEVILISLKGGASTYVNVGNYEFLQVQSVSSNVVTFTTNRVYWYGEGSGNNTNVGSTQFVKLQRVPNYTTVTINGGSITANAWVTGGTGGVIAFRANGTVSVNVANGINTNALGFLAGAGGTYSTAAGGGESYNGTGGIGGTYAANNAGQGQGGGGGGGTYDSTTYPGATGAVGSGGGGGGVGLSTGTPAALGGGGGGGGHGQIGNGGVSYNNGNYGSGASGGTGGNGALSTYDFGGGGGGGGTDGRTAGVGGSATLNTKAYMGGGGAGSGGSYAGYYSGTSSGAAGGRGGGIIFIGANQITVNSSGSIAANGANGATGYASGAGTYSAGGGGGAGGSIILIAETISNAGSIIANFGNGGNGGSGVPSYTGGAGGGGRTYARFITGPGTAPTPYYYYGGTP